jgi:hypothetical protein
MRTTRLIAVLVGLAAIAMVTADAHAIYHPGMGRFMQRDPGAGGAHRVGAGGPASGGGFMPRDQYADGMNLYQYVRGNPVTALDPMGLKAWTEATAKAELTKQITSWRGSGYNFAADLMQHFVDKKGPQDYTPTQANIDEVKKHGRDRILDEVFGHIWKGHGIDPPDTGVYNVNITHPGKGSNAESNIRWWYIGDNKNMLYAYGGADLNVTGKAYTIQNRKIVLGVFLVRTDWHWSGNINVRLGDLYTFDSSWAKKTLSAAWSDPYDAALWLETKCSYKPFYHEMTFDLGWKSLGLPDLYYKVKRQFDMAVGW